MTYGSLADMDAADERAERREAARAQVRGGQPPLYRRDPIEAGLVPMPILPAPTPKPTVPTPSAMPATKAPATATPPAFRLVGDLPTTKGGRRPIIPPIRQQLIDFAKDNVDQWIEYRSTNGDKFTKPSSVVSQIRKGAGGFGPGFEAAVRGGQLYIRYVGTTEECGERGE